jgi:NAD+ kinase
MRRVGVVLHAGKPEAAATGRWLAETLLGKGIEVVALPLDAERIGTTAARAVDVLPDDLDLVFVFGGDGTLLRAAELVRGTKTPLLGVNFGHLGFLSALERGDLEGGLQRLLDDGFDVEERMLLDATIDRGGGSTEAVRAMNDIVVEKVAAGRAIRMAVSIGGEPLMSWAADGIIVATATGSTAYSFSAGGPVVSPRLDCLVLTPVAPHGLFNRALVVPPDEEIVVELLPEADASALSADGGPARPLEPGARVTVRAAPDRIRLAKVKPSPFWRLLREKFRLSSDP